MVRVQKVALPTQRHQEANTSTRAQPLLIEHGKKQLERCWVTTCGRDSSGSLKPPSVKQKTCSSCTARTARSLHFGYFVRGTEKPAARGHGERLFSCVQWKSDLLLAQKNTKTKPLTFRAHSVLETPGNQSCSGCPLFGDALIFPTPYKEGWLWTLPKI